MNAAGMNKRGFTLVEMMISLTIMLFVILALVTLIITTQSAHLTEGRKLDMNQGARMVEQMLYDGFRSAGSVLSLANTPALLGGTALPFNGVYPLNNSGYPDGVILSSGDPDALTRLTADFAPGSTLLNVMSVNLGDGSAVAWQQGDIGMIMRTDGYYVFRVEDPVAMGDTELGIRNTAVYYSGLLNTAHYNDACDDQLGTLGNNGNYLSESPVLRLDYFNIYLVRTENDGSRTLTLTTDCEGVGDIFAVGAPITNTRAVPILPNIEDIQIEYLTHDVPPLIWAGSDGARGNPCPAGSESSGDCSNFYSQFYTKNISSARIFVLLRTEEERNKHEGSGVVYVKPLMGDTAGGELPVGRYHYTYMQYEVLIRNYNNIY
jgi:prepilin-type N-terminal cleavage/methylation domain-containing protein